MLWMLEIHPTLFRMMALYGSTWNDIKKDILGYWYSDQQTKAALKRIYAEYQYLMDPSWRSWFLRR